MLASRRAGQVASRHLLQPRQELFAFARMNSTSTPQPVAAGAAPATVTATPIPEGYIVHRERSASVLLAKTPELVAQVKGTDEKEVFLNPIQEFNRDLSVVAIRVWSERRNEEKQAQWREMDRKKEGKNARKRARGAAGEAAVEGEAGPGDLAVGAAPEAKKARLQGNNREDGAAAAVSVEAVTEVDSATSTAETGKDAQAEELRVEAPSQPRKRDPPIYTFKAIEALSATGLRAIRYAKEIPLLSEITANDLSKDAAEHIRRNVALNGLLLDATSPTPNGKIKVTEGDALTLLYSQRDPKLRVGLVDLDPYGSAVPFLDAAVGATEDGGLLCVTCTDAGVLAGHNYPEKCFSAYGGVCIAAEYSHEHALRLVLHAIATTAARYGRYIEPLLSLSIDYYLRVFVRVHTGAKKVKELASQTALVYVCHDCLAYHFQPLGATKTRTNGPNTNTTYHAAPGPPVGERCDECGGRFHLGGPIWAGPLHEKAFVRKMVDCVEAESKDKEEGAGFGTEKRLLGMLSVAAEEIEAPYYFSPGKMAGLFHCVSPPMAPIAAALVNAGFEISRPHAAGGSIKTSAPPSAVRDLFRSWVAQRAPVNVENVKAGSPARRLLDKEPGLTFSFERNEKAEEILKGDGKGTKYQMNPTPFWGPQKAAKRGAPATK